MFLLFPLSVHLCSSHCSLIFYVGTIFHRTELSVLETYLGCKRDNVKCKLMPNRCRKWIQGKYFISFGSAILACLLWKYIRKSAPLLVRALLLSFICHSLTTSSSASWWLLSLQLLLSNFHLPLPGLCIVSLFSFICSFLFSFSPLSVLLSISVGPRVRATGTAVWLRMKLTQLWGLASLCICSCTLSGSFFNVVLCLSCSICLVWLLMHCGTVNRLPLGNELWKWRSSPAGLWNVSRE